MATRILVLEDSDVDFQRLLQEFNRSHFPHEVQRVIHRPDLLLALADFRPEVVVSSYQLRGWSGLEALEVVRRQAPDVPFLFLTHPLSEEIAVTCIKQGAADYVLKSRIPLLIPSLRVALERAKSSREAQKFPREAEEVLRLTPDLFCHTSLDGTLRSVNPAWLRLTGFAPQELLGRSLLSLIHPEDKRAMEAWWSAIIRSNQTASPFNPGEAGAPADFECRVLHKSDGVRFVQWSAKPLIPENKVFAYGHDLTLRKRAEVALRESESRFRRMADSAPVLIWMADLHRNFTYFNKPWLEFTGRAISAELNQGWITGIHPEDLEHALSRFDDGLSTRSPFRVEFRMKRHDQRYRWIVTHGTPRYDDHGTFAGFIGSCFDVTEQHEVEAHLAYRAIKQSALAAYGRFALAQHTFPELCQEATRLVADTLRVERSHVLILASPELDLAVSASTGPALDEAVVPYGKADPSVIEDDVPIQLEDSPNLFPGAQAFRSIGINSGLAIPIGTGKHAYGFITALTRESRLFNRESIDFIQGIAHILSTVHQRERAETALVESEQKLLQSQKMEAVGLLAGGVAHDFNNLLTAIRCYGDILHEDLGPISLDLKSKASEILKATARATALVRQLLAFTRKQVLQPEILDLNQVVGDLRDLIRSLLTENIELNVDLAEESLTIEADRSQIEQVLMNMAINARDAMPMGGRLSISTGHKEIGLGDDPDLKAGRYAMFTIGDTGSGMSEDIQAKIFQPFFTTKPKGRGTGLGLATCTVVIKNYNGAIRFKSELGKGTTFYVLVPLGEKPPETLDFDFDAPPDAGNETLLIVEDDEAIRAVTATILRSLGYHVYAFGGGEDALEFMSSPGAPPCDLLVSDIVMPNMGGRELGERLVALKPGLKVLFMSGYVDDPVILQAVQEAAVPFLEKPFTRESLAKKVREALELPRK